MTLRALACILIASSPVIAQPHVSGNRIVARDGDTIVVEGEARVRIVRRRDANVRTIFNPAERWLIVLADTSDGRGGPDGVVDTTYRYTGLTGDWPMEDRWEGAVTLEEHAAVGSIGNGDLGIVGPRGLILLTGPPSTLRDPAAIAVLTYRGSGRGGSRGSFDEAERAQVQQTQLNAARQTQMPLGATMSMGLSVSGVAANPGLPPPEAPIRVGGSVRQPRKLVDATPVVPEQAIQAGVTGVVILEITIDAEGTVKDARVLRGIPLLDQAAVDAARQWRFEPTLLNGQPVPVIMTATVSFLR